MTSVEVNAVGTVIVWSLVSVVIVVAVCLCRIGETYSQLAKVEEELKDTKRQLANMTMFRSHAEERVETRGKIIEGNEETILEWKEKYNNLMERVMNAQVRDCTLRRFLEKLMRERA